MKKYIFLVLFFLISKPTVTQWVLDYQFNPPGSRSISSFSLVDSNYLWIVTRYSQDSGKFYKKINSNIIEINSNGIFRPYKIKAIDTARAYLSATYQMLYYTSNSGNNWFIRLDSVNGLRLDYGIANNNNNFIVVFKYDFDSLNNKFYKSTNGGVSWDIQTINLPEDHFDYNLSITDAQHIWLGINCQATNCTELIYLYTTNGGTNWLTKTFPLVSNNTTIMAAVFKKDNITGFTFSPGYYYYRYKTINGGENWSAPEYFSFGNTEGLSGIVNIDSTQIWFCAKARNVYKTTNDGISWTEMTIPLHDSDRIGALDVIRKNNKYYAYIGTSRGTIFKLVEGIPIGIKTISNEVPKSFTLFQNYPNPFNPVTKIRFGLPPSPQGEGLGVRVIIYDILGREVETLVNKQLQPGIYEVDWPAPTGDGANYPSGIYYYKMVANGYVETKKMVLVK